MSSTGYETLIRVQIATTVLNFALTGVQTTLSALAIHRLSQIRHLPARTFIWSCGVIITLWLSFSVQTLGSFPVLLAVFRYDFDPKFWDKMYTLVVATMATLTATADSLLTFRCWVIWERSHVFIIPAVLIAMKFALMVTTVFMYALGWGRTRLPALRVMADVSIALSLAFNVLIAGAAIVRLLQLRAGLRRATRASGSHYTRVAQIIALNAGLWLVGCIMGFVFIVGSVAAPMVCSINSFLLAACPLLLFLHIGRHTPRACGDVSLPSLPPPKTFWARHKRKRSMADIITLHEALRIPGTLQPSQHEL